MTLDFFFNLYSGTFIHMNVMPYFELMLCRIVQSFFIFAFILIIVIGVYYFL